MKFCAICSDPTVKRHRFCPRHDRFFKGTLQRAKEPAMIAAFDKTIGKCRCFYTNLILDEDDPDSPLFLTFDHPIPGDDTVLVVCANFVNHLKSAMTETEFRTNIPLLADHFENGTVLTWDNFRIEHFHSHPPKGRFPAMILPPEPPLPRWFSETCKICGKPPVKRGLYCKRCQAAIVGNQERVAKEAALIGALDKTCNGFRCRYTGIIVDLDKPPGPYHLSYDHRFPGHPGNIVVCLFIINFMKSALSDEEFRTIVIRLARHFTTGEPFGLEGVKFEYWR